MLMSKSLFSVLVFSPSTVGYESPWMKEADDLKDAAEKRAERESLIVMAKGDEGAIGL